MKIKHLTITNFLGISHADLELSPVTLFLGDNEQGKSSIADAIYYGFTGIVPHRGIQKKNQARMLAHNGAERFDVRLETSEAVYARNQSNRTPTFASDIEVSSILLQPQSVIHLKPEYRQKIFRAILDAGQTDDDQEEIDNALRHIAGKDFAEEIVRLYHEHSGDLNAIKKWIVSKRREAKAIKNSLGEKPIVNNMVDIGNGKPYNLSDPKFHHISESVDNATLLLAQTESQLAACRGICEDVEPSAILDNIRRIEAELKELKKKRQSLPDLANIANKESHLMQKVARLQQQKQHATEEVERLAKEDESIHSVCPTCGQAIPQSSIDALRKDIANKKSKAEQDRDLFELDLAQSTLKLQTATGERKRAERAAVELDRNIERLSRELERESKKNKAIAEIPLLEKKKEEQESNLNGLRQLKKAYDKYVSDMRALDEWTGRNRKLDAIIESANNIDQALSPSGSISTLVAKRLNKLRFDEPLQADWGMESLKLNSDGSVTYGGRPIEMASSSAIWRAGVLLAELLARSSSEKFLILDGADILSPQTRKPLFARLPVWKDIYDTIIILATAAKPAAKKPIDWLRYYWVEGGRVSAL